MKRLLPTLSLSLAALLALGACSQQPEEEDNLVINVTTGQEACEPVMFEESPLTHCVADPRRHQIRMVLGPDGGPPYRSLKAFAEDRPGDAPVVAFAMNGGMFDEDGEPVGYYVSSGRRLTVLNQTEGPGNFHLKPNGVFFGTGDQWQVLDSESFSERILTRPQFATQSGPMLVIDGELHEAFDSDGQSTKIRNGVGVDGGGRAHFVISEAPISFGKFGRYFRDVLEIPNALFLDGTVSALWDPARQRIDDGAPLGPLIVVENKGRQP
ncbi:phosphodiester glycosidase family protein [Tsuneonella sp. HG222]